MKRFLVFLTGMMCLSLVCLADKSGSLTVSPGKDVSWSCVLAPYETANLTITVAPAPSGYRLKSQKTDITRSHPDFIWGGGYSVANTILTSAVTRVKVSCIWEPIPGVGEGPGPRPPDLYGSATGIARALPGEYWNVADAAGIAVGESTYVYAWREGNESAPSSWSISGPASIQGYSTYAKVTGTAPSASEYDVVVSSTCNESGLSDSEYLTVVGVTSIEAEPEIVCVGGEVSYIVTTQPEGFEFMVDYTPADTSEPGIHEVVATCGTSSATTTVTVVAMEITGFSLDPTWARGNDCNVSNHMSVCEATIQPTNFSITFSVQGDAYGATIDAETGIITPAVNESGIITVRAAVTDLPTCFDERPLLIRARPTSITDSSAVNSPGVYGGAWTHTFSGTGGNLDDVLISEKVRTREPNPFGYSFSIDPGPPNVWTLDANGTMTDADWYITATHWFDARDFLPSPPKDGLPQTGTDDQWYYWWCPLDNHWSEFSGPATIDVTLMEHEHNLIVRTAAYGQSTDDDYIGPAVLEDIEMDPVTILANEIDQSQGSVIVTPQVRTVIWSIQGDNLGATIDAGLGIVTAGSEAGQITVRVADSLYTGNYLETQLTLEQP